MKMKFLADPKPVALLPGWRRLAARFERQELDERQAEQASPANAQQLAPAHAITRAPDRPGIESIITS